MKQYCLQKLFSEILSHEFAYAADCSWIVAASPPYLSPSYPKKLHVEPGKSALHGAPSNLVWTVHRILSFIERKLGDPHKLLGGVDYPLVTGGPKEEDELDKYFGFRCKVNALDWNQAQRCRNVRFNEDVQGDIKPRVVKPVTEGKSRILSDGSCWAPIPYMQSNHSFISQLRSDYPSLCWRAFKEEGTLGHNENKVLCCMKIKTAKGARRGGRR